MAYKIGLDRVVDMFTSIAGNENQTDGRIFCRSAADMLGGRLDTAKPLAENDYNICYAAATMANYRFVIKENCSAVNIRAGDITVNENAEKSVDNAKRLMDDAIEGISHLLKSRRFAFIKTGE